MTTFTVTRMCDPVWFTVHRSQSHTGHRTVQGKDPAVRDTFVTATGGGIGERSGSTFHFCSIVMVKSSISACLPAGSVEPKIKSKLRTSAEFCFDVDDVVVFGSNN